MTKAYDFLIVGSGAGALVAAVTAKVAGLEPLVIEKTDLVGGSTALSGGILWLPNNPLMARESVTDTREASLTYLANFTSDTDLVSTPTRRAGFVDAIPAMIAAMEEQGMRYRRCPGYCDYYDDLPGGHAQGRSIQAELFDLNRLGSWKGRFRRSPTAMPLRTSEARRLLLMKRTAAGALMAMRLGSRIAVQRFTGKDVVGSGGSLQGRMLEIVLRLGIDVWTGTALASLDIENGRVVGAHLRRGNEIVTVRAPRGVLIAAGGFARNLAMREKFQPHPASDSWTKANPGDTGEVIAMMEAAGAALGTMDQAWWIQTLIPPGQNPHHAVPETGKPLSIMVDASGSRFVNESASYMEIGNAMYARNETVSAIPAWHIMDARYRRRYFYGVNPPGAVKPEWIESGWMKRADTIGDLARQCGIDPAGLEATVARFNMFCREGRDPDFARGANVYNRYYGDPTVKPNPCLGPIEQGPFLAAPLMPGDAGTCGGACIDENGRVVRPDKSVIDGLYATGNSTASLSGPYYAGAGLSIGASSVFGYLAARHAQTN
ncbi:FAD-binding protein [Sphingopyxis sp. JAI128]|uniref:FAD-binding protein n=1 Tax=Sphingopyxis sp. JAI128 TaxID=2723066 RepID=UPI00160FBF76|nr:FAD-binding protein [Sphingopyxis sp. JAI128]MBB6426867.1 3-oxosteroid 1-dehydrogenase [Sphingopyxis sp. JAI128]